MASVKSRNRKTGKYSFEGQWDRLCVCGHALRHHLAEAPHGCIEIDFTDVDCSCEEFRPAKAAKKTRTKVPNPAPGKGALVALGHLTKLEYRDAKDGRTRTLKWSLKKAPILAYVVGAKAASLRIVYDGRPKGPSSGAERREYARTHWGVAGKGELLDGRMLEGPAPKLGPAISVTYTTRKGDTTLTDFHHPFGVVDAAGTVAEHFIPPGVVCHRGMVRLSGGTYRVDTDGIVG